MTKLLLFVGRLKEFLPKEYVKIKGIEKKIYQVQLTSYGE
jgi:hypothetical protein